jgi:hypothetical protein
LSSNRFGNVSETAHPENTEKCSLKMLKQDPPGNVLVLCNVLKIDGLKKIVWGVALGAICGMLFDAGIGNAILTARVGT